MPVPESQGLELGLIAKVAQLFDAVANPARTEELAAVGADEARTSAGAVGRNEETAFHFQVRLFSILNRDSKGCTNTGNPQLRRQAGVHPEYLGTFLTSANRLFHGAIALGT